jgi:hypothetical protein
MRLRIEPALMAPMLMFGGAILNAERLAAELQAPVEATVAKKDDSGISWNDLTIARVLLALESSAASAGPGHERTDPGTGS